MEKKLRDILLKVEKPGRYIGNEMNIIKKDIKEDTVKFALAFADIYEVGISHLGSHILYGLMNSLDYVACERVYCPWTDMEELMRENDIELYSLENKQPLSTFDFIGFTLQYEMSYTNILNMINLSNMSLESKDRTEEDPIILAAGPCAYNPEPLADIVDMFIIGEGEEVNLEILKLYKDMKDRNCSKEDYLREVSKIEGIYVPKYYNVQYKEDGTIDKFEPISSEFPKKIQKRIVNSLEDAYYPEKMIVPFIEVIHDRVMVEIFRGCTRGCRFCQAGMIYRPVRERSKENILNLAKQLLEVTGYEGVSLSSLSTSDYSEIEDLVVELMEKLEKEKISLSLPSLRIDKFPMELLEEIQKTRKTGLTFAPEAGSQRLRDVINKGIEEEDILSSTKKAFTSGWAGIKLYFMLGLPTETNEDVLAIKELAYKIKDMFFELPNEEKKGNLRITVSTSCFVPKPFTPYQWYPQVEIQEFDKKIKLLKDSIRDNKISYDAHNSKLSFLEGVIARGDRRVSKVIIEAYKLGCKFDGWADHFDYEKWMEAFEITGVDPKFYANRERDYNEVLPWDFIDIGVSKEYLIRENEKSKVAELTRDCRDGCTDCGINKSFLGGVC